MEPKEELVQLSKSLKIEEKVFFGGLIPKHEVVKWFSVSTASFVTFRDLPVLHTSSPNKMFDSFAAGVPIIQSTKGWISDLVQKENCGINVFPDDPYSFGKAIGLLGLEVTIREMMSGNALRLAKTDFSRDLLAQKYLGALENLNSR
jgi:glycosyltransferase involved in cell wall biosynthesis